MDGSLLADFAGVGIHVVGRGSSLAFLLLEPLYSLKPSGRIYLRVDRAMVVTAVCLRALILPTLQHHCDLRKEFEFVNEEFLALTSSRDYAPEFLCLLSPVRTM